MGSEGGDSSSSGSQDEPWDRMEDEAMRALDDKLAALCPAVGVGAGRPGASPQSAPAADPGTSCSVGAGGAAPAVREDDGHERVVFRDSGQLLRDLCRKDPYNPEDHVLTAEEMWGGGSSEDEGVASGAEAPVSTAVRVAWAPEEPAAVHGSPRAAARGEADAPRGAGAPCCRPAGTGPALGAAAEPPAPAGAARGAGDGALREAQPCAPSVGGLFQRACQLEPYRPEDHVLTAEEMWGDSGSDAPAEEAPGPALVDEDRPLTAQEMWGGMPAESMPLCVPEAVAEAPRPVSPAERLARILAGPQAPQCLAALDFEELGAVAEDCQRAVETLRWVLARQRAMLGRAEGAPAPAVGPSTRHQPR